MLLLRGVKKRGSGWGSECFFKVGVFLYIEENDLEKGKAGDDA